MLVGILEDSSDRFITDLVSRLSDIPVEFIRLADERLPVERGYRVVVDRLSFRYPFLKEIVKSLALSGTYVINNPYAASATNKLIDMQVGRQLELAFPKTIVLPDQAATAEADSLVMPPNLQRVADEIGFPCILKPFNGYAWQDVHVIRSVDELQNLYDTLAPRHILLAQQLIRFKDYFRVFCIDKKDVLFIRYVPRPSAMGQYLHCDLSKMKDVADRLADLTVRFNRALDLDVNVVEWCVDEEGRWWVIDAFNEVPEIIPEALPPEYYSWILDKFVACIKDKLESGKKNRIPFG
jgi:glutathione synthase/RimK-type ligase-like ATP-grasp enzyme